MTLVFRITPDQRKPCLTMPHSDYSNIFKLSYNSKIYIIHLVKAQKHKRCSPKAPPATLHNFGSLLLQQLIVIDVPVTRQLGGRIFALLVLPSFSFDLICALRSQQLYLNCRNPTMLHFQWESREIHIQFQLSERDSCLGMNFAVCTESRQATAVHGMTTSVQRTAQKTITS